MNESDSPRDFASQSSPPNRAQSKFTPDQFESQFKRMESKSFFQVVDTTLKRPAQAIYELMQQGDAKVPLLLLVLLVASLSATGLMMGSYSGGAQLWAVPLKVVLGTLAAGLICLPSLYILLCLCGGTQNFGQTCRMLLLGLALAGILFIGFIPVAWIFSQATESYTFMGVLYLLIWGIGLFFGFRLMHRAFQFLNKRSMGALRLWIIIFALVLLQMSTTLRPLIGSFEPLQFNEKMFFIEHWAGQ